MPDYAPVLTCCDPVGYLGEVFEWRHSVTCLLSPERPITTPHGNCPAHPSEDLWTCRGCEINAELKREQEEGIV